MGACFVSNDSNYYRNNEKQTQVLEQSQIVKKGNTNPSDPSMNNWAERHKRQKQKEADIAYYKMVKNSVLNMNIKSNQDKIIPNDLRRLKNEIRQIQTQSQYIDAGIGIEYGYPAYNVRASIMGKNGTPYDGGTFYIDITVPKYYPFSTPNAHFISKVYHPNFGKESWLDIPMLIDAWEPASGLGKLLFDIKNQLDYPNKITPWNQKAYDQCHGNNKARAEYERIAKEWTVKYAMYTIPKYPRIVDIIYKYDICRQCMLCQVEVDHNNADFDANEVERVGFVINDGRNYKAFGFWVKEKMCYEFEVDVELEYGSVNYWRAETRFEAMDDNGEIVLDGVISVIDKEIYVDILGKDNGCLFIAGYLRQSMMEYNVDVVIPMDVMGLCYDYWYKWFVVLECGSYQKQIMLMDDDDIKRFQRMNDRDYKALMGKELDFPENKRPDGVKRFIYFDDQIVTKIENISAKSFPLFVKGSLTIYD